MSNKDYILTRHAKARMQSRGISEEEIEKILLDPEVTYPGKSGEINVIKEVNPGKKIRVVYKTEQGKKIILTALICEE